MNHIPFHLFIIFFWKNIFFSAQFATLLEGFKPSNAGPTETCLLNYCSCCCQKFLINAEHRLYQALKRIVFIMQLCTIYSLMPAPSYRQSSLLPRAGVCNRQRQKRPFWPLSHRIKVTWSDKIFDAQIKITRHNS